MPRKPRMYMAGMPCHVVQRGNNRDATFYSDDDYQFYLTCLDDGVKRYRVAVHAFVLMTEIKGVGDKREVKLKGSVTEVSPRTHQINQ